tara:strand:+ start:1081 stop:1269 length:189 start_codon:yes stop_codon:yes gene_type:complete
MTTTTIRFSDFVRLFSLEGEPLATQKETACEAGWTFDDSGGQQILTRATNPPLIYRALRFLR